MSFKTPIFWYRDKDSSTPLQEALLTPLSALYAGLGMIRSAITKPYKSSIPVICIGNITAGGSGKTPTAIALHKYIKEKKLANKPVFLTRGYGGCLSGVLVDIDQHKIKDVGDEALLLARHAPTIVANNRAQGAKMAEEQGADLIIMDDGLQNPTLHKDLIIQVIDGEKGFGNEKIIPAGPLRSSFRKEKQNTDIFIINGKDVHNTSARIPKEKLQLVGRLIPKEIPSKEQKYIAFAGLGHPDKFFHYLERELKLSVLKTIPFADHHPYKENEIARLIEEAKSDGAQLITTEKDAVRIPPELRGGILTLPVELQLSPLDSLEQALLPLLSKGGMK